MRPACGRRAAVRLLSFLRAGSGMCDIISSHEILLSHMGKTTEIPISVRENHVLLIQLRVMYKYETCAKLDRFHICTFHAVVHHYNQATTNLAFHSNETSQISFQ